MVAAARLVARGADRRGGVGARSCGLFNRRHRRADEPVAPTSESRLGAISEAIVELSRSIELSPNFALGHYTLGFVEAQSGDPRLAIEATNTSRELSPFDPLQFGMLGSHAVAHLRIGELDEAASWALKAIARPNAHVHILPIAASTLSLTDRQGEARKLVARIRERGVHANHLQVEARVPG